MDSTGDPGVTELLIRWSGGHESALAELLPQVYDELVRIARIYMDRENRGHTLETGALINEAYLKLVDQKRVRLKDRNHFIAIAAITMRRILINYAYARRAQKRGGDTVKVPLDDFLHHFEETQKVEFIELHETLLDLEKVDQHLARIVELRFFAGLTIEESAEALDISVSKVKLDWEMARAWLFRALKRKF